MIRKTWKRKVLTATLALAMVAGSVNTTAFVSYAEEVQTGSAIVFTDLNTKLYYSSESDGGWGGDSNVVMNLNGTTATFTADSFGSSQWAVQWQNIEVSSSAAENILSFDVVSTIDKQIYVKNETTSKDIKVSLKADEKQTVQIAGGATAKFMMDLSYGGAGTVTISNMTYTAGSLVEEEPDNGSDDDLRADAEALDLAALKEAEQISEYASCNDSNWGGDSNVTYTYDGTSATIAADSFGSSQWAVQWLLKDLTSDSTANVFEFEVTSTTDKSIVFKNENSGDVYTLTLTANQKQRFAYEVEGDTFSATFDLAGGSGSLTFSNVKFGPNDSVAEAPTVVPAKANDKANGYKVGEDVVLNAADAADWAEAVSSIVVNNKTVAADKYTVDAEEGTITIDASVFAKQNVYTIAIAADGYAALSLTMPVYAADVADEEWVTEWSDEFDGDSLDETKWSYEIGVKSGDDNDASNGAPIHWGNDEKEYYTKEAVKVEDGYLVITGDELTDEIKEQYGITDTFVQYSSGRIRTITDDGKLLAGTTYGRVEAKISMPASKGYWPAFWMLPATETVAAYGSWPASGEIDIMEAVGQNADKVDGTIHYGGYDWTKHVYSGGNYYFTDDSTIADEHVYAIEWEPGEIRWYVDDVLYHIENNWYGADATGQEFTYPAPFDEDFYILFNLAMSGNYVSNVDPDEMGLEMKVDYVKIMKDNNTDYDAEVKEPAGIEKDSEFFEANGGYVDVIVDKDFETLPDNAYGDGGNLLPGNEKWWSSVNTDAGAAAEVSVENGAAKIAVSNIGANDYNVQLIQNIPLAQGYTYRVTFDAWTDVTTGRTIRVAPGGDCNHGWASYATGINAELGTEKQTYTFDFTMAKASDPSARFEMNIGGSTGTVYIDNVSIIALTDEQMAEDGDNGTKDPLANGDYIYNGTFDKGEGRLGYWTVEGAEGSTQNRDYTVTVGEEETKLIQSGLKLTQYDDYVLTFDGCSADMGAVMVAISAEDLGKIYFEKRFELGDKLDQKTVKFTVPAGEGTDKGVLTFTFIGEGKTITIDNVSMKRTTNAGIEWDKFELFPMGKGNDLLTGWSVYDEVWNWSTSEVTAKELGNGEIGFEVKTIPADQSYKVMLQHPDIALAKNMTYTIKYAVKASAENQSVGVSFEDSSYASCYSKTLTVGEEWTYVEDTFTTDSMGSRTLKFLLAGVDQECYVYVKDVSIELDAPKPQFKEGKEISHMKPGESFRLEFEHDRKVQDKFEKFTYKTEDTDIIEIDEEGNIKAKATGEATITVVSSIGTEYSFVVSVTADDDEDENPFGDVAEGIWYYQPAVFAYKYGLMGGKGKFEDGSLRFDPAATITRAEFVQMLYGKEGKPTVGYQDTFTDVPEGKWYTDAILWAAENEIAGGKKADFFDVNGQITRQEIAVMLKAYVEFKGYDTTMAGDLTGFTDADIVANWGEAAMKWAVANDVIGGKNTADGGVELSPNGNAIRAEAATMLKAFMVSYNEVTE